MSVELGGKLIEVFIVKKNNKNMYLRIKEDGIHISCNYFVTKSMILNFIMSNEKMIVEAYDRLQKKKEKKEEFYYLGNRYDVIVLNTVSKIEFYGDKVFVKNKTYLNTFLYDGHSITLLPISSIFLYGISQVESSSIMKSNFQFCVYL